MSNEAFFFACGIALAASAVATSLLGLRIKSFPGRAAPLVALWFVLLVGASMTFAVLHAQDEENAKAAELTTAGEEITKEESSPVKSGNEGAPAQESQPAAKGPGGTLQLAASSTALAFDKTTLASKPGKVTIDLSNPASIEHDVAIEQNGKVIAESELISKGKTSVTANLAPGTYAYLCTVPGHAEAGMEGVLTVR
ncbi:MAG TPA: plastocyanin/azurin family copper-binding protein [Solirubrobacterales bacterium]|jgi:plastocyanin